MRVAFGVMALVVSSGCAAHRFECTVHGGSVVREVETEHFIVASDLDEELLRKQATQLEQLWVAWALFFHQVPQTPAKLRVVLSESGATSEFMPGWAGFVRLSATPVLISDVRLDPNGKGYTSSNAHEMAHFVSYFVLRRQPRWLGEGLASYLGDARFVRTDAVRMGHWQWNGEDPDSLATLWSWDEMLETGSTQSQRYGSSWAWVHFFQNREEARFTRLLTLLRTAESPRAAFEEVFPEREWPELERRVRSYLSEGRYQGWEASNLPEPAVSAARVVAPWEVHLLRRTYSDGKAARRKETTEARALAGAQPAGAVVLAEFEDTRGPEQSEVLDALPGDAHAELQASRAPDLSPLRQFQLAESAAKVLTADAEAQARFAELAADRGDARALDASARVLKMAPWWSDAYLIRASALASQGKCTAAKSTLEDARSLAHDGDTSLVENIERGLKILSERCEERP